MEHPQRWMPTVVPLRFALDLNLPNQRSNRLNGIGNRKKPDRRNARIDQARMNASADSPNLRFARQRCEGLDGIISDDVVELPNQSLIGSEHDGANRMRLR